MEQCVWNNDDDYDGEEPEFEIQEFAECCEVEYGDDDGGPQHYIAPYCANVSNTIRM